MKQIKVKADTAELDNVLSFADAILEELGCSVKAQMQIDIAIEEIFVNIAHYAYPESEGEAVISVEPAQERRPRYHALCGRPSHRRPGDIHGQEEHGRSLL